MKLNCRINELKKREGRTTNWIANELKVSPEIVSRWANNRSFPSVKTLFKLAIILRCKVDDLYEVIEE